MFLNGATTSCLHHSVPKPLSYSLKAGALSPGHQDVGGWGPQTSFLCAGPPSTHRAQHGDRMQETEVPGQWGHGTAAPSAHSRLFSAFQW